jgi:iron complex outermembrane receptor protein
MSDVRLKPRVLSVAVLLLLGSPSLTPIVHAQDAVNLAPIAVQGVANDRVDGPAQSGTINIVHYAPSPTLHYGGSLQAGSFGTMTGSAYVTGPTGVNGLDYRIDATASHTDGFRDLGGRDREIRPAFRWQWSNHVSDLAFDLRNIHETPDSYGLIYFNGTPIHDVSRNAKYSSPFSESRSDFARTTLSDQWTVNDNLTINNRFSYLHRSLDVVVNGDSASTKVNNGQVVSRQLREQNDSERSIDYQFEPVWRFATGSVQHMRSQALLR